MSDIQKDFYSMILYLLWRIILAMHGRSLMENKHWDECYEKIYYFREKYKIKGDDPAFDE